MKLRKLLIATGILILLAALIPVIHHYQLRFATSHYIAQLKAKGELMDLAQLRPPAIPAGQNSADTFQKAAALFGSDLTLLNQNYNYDCMKMVRPGKAIAGSEQPLAMAPHRATNSWEEMAAAVAQNKDSFDLLQEIIDKPAFDFDVPYEQGTAGIASSQLYFPEMRNASMRLQAAALSDLHRGDSAAAVKDARAILALVKAVRTVEIIRSEFMRISFSYRAINSTWEILQSTNVTDDQLAPLQHDWQDLQFVAAEEKVVALQSVLDAVTIENWRHSDADLWRWFGPRPAPSINATVQALAFRPQIFCWQYWGSYRSELLAFKGYQVVLDTSRFQKTNSFWTVARQQTTNGLAKLEIPSTSKDGDLRFIFASEPNYGINYFDRAITAEAWKQLAAAAVALKRYQLKYGKYPQNLSALVPEFLPEILRDPIDGQPLRYRLNQDGTFLLYSIGDNGKDDGGDATSDNSRSLEIQDGRDWVWPQRATPQEIQNFINHSPK